ncbi:MAG: hypothetical protein KAW12_01825 [Candidatus Aminicenantes bacterium]|nr:hypothetical protein [Candidatus Aminicenantes bacterium]
MKLSAPNKIFFVISLLFVIISLVAHFVNIPYATRYHYWIMLCGWTFLAAGVTAKDL